MVHSLHHSTPLADLIRAPSSQHCAARLALLVQRASSLTSVRHAGCPDQVRARRRWDGGGEFQCPTPSHAARGLDPRAQVSALRRPVGTAGPASIIADVGAARWIPGSSPGKASVGWESSASPIPPPSRRSRIWSASPAFRCLSG